MHRLATEALTGQSRIMPGPAKPASPFRYLNSASGAGAAGGVNGDWLCSSNRALIAGADDHGASVGPAEAAG